MGSMMGYYYDAADYTASMRGVETAKPISVGGAMEEERELAMQEKTRLEDEAREQGKAKKKSTSIFGPLHGGEAEATGFLNEASIYRVPDENQFKGDWKTPVIKKYAGMESVVEKRKKEEAKMVEKALKIQLDRIDKKKDDEFKPTAEESVTDLRLTEKDWAMRQAQAKKEALQQNEIYSVFMEDVNNHDHLHSQRMPWAMTQEITERLNVEAMRGCYELAKELANCYSDKAFTQWKCRKEHNTYMRCIKIVKEDPGVKDQLIWKYKMGVYRAEQQALNHIVATLWDSYWPDTQIGPGWITDDREWKRESMQKQMNK